MIRRTILLPALLLAACNGADDRTAAPDNAADGIQIAIGGDNEGVRIAGGDEIAIDVPGFQAKLKIPDIDLDPAKLNLNGIGLYPGSDVTAVRAGGDAGADGGGATIAFRSAATPDTLIDYYASAAEAEGYAVTRSAGNAGLSAVKADDRIALALKPAADGTTGEIRVGGGSR